MQDQPKQIYLEYCSKSQMEPSQELLDIIDAKEESYRHHRGEDEDPETAMQESDMFALCLVLSQNLETFLDLEIVNEVLDPSYLSMLASAFAHNTHLERLALVSDSVDDEGVQNLMAVLVDNNPLVELNLSQNLIKDSGAEALSQALLSEDCRLERISLSNNMIETDYFGPVLEGKTELRELDLSYNNYTVESLAMILQGAANNNTLLRLNLAGIKAAAELNPMMIVETIRANTTIQELTIDVEFDEESMTKLEEVLLENSTLIYFISGNCNITLENPHTAKVFKLLKANEWIAVNYEKLCNNEAVECSDVIEEYVKAKLEIITLKLIDQQEGDFVEEESARLEESQLESQRQEGSQHEHEVKPHDISEVSQVSHVSGSQQASHREGGSVEAAEEEEENKQQQLRKITPRSNNTESQKERSLEKIPTDRTASASGENLPVVEQKVEKVEKEVRAPEQEKIDMEARYKMIEEEMEKKLMGQFSKMFHEVLSNEIKSFSSQVHNVMDRLDTIEEKVSKIETKVKDLESVSTQSLRALNQREVHSNAADARLTVLEAQVTVLDNKVQDIESRPPLVSEIVTETKRESEKGYNNAEWEAMITQRNEFEKTARTHFEGIFRKVEDLEGLMDQMLQDQLKSQQITSKQLETSVIKEKEGIEKIVTDRVEGIIVERLSQFEENYKAGVASLRSTVYDTQNRMKNLEHTILENADLDFKGYKKRNTQNPPASTNPSVKPQQTSMIRSQVGAPKADLSVTTANNRTQVSTASKATKPVAVAAQTTSTTTKQKNQPLNQQVPSVMRTQNVTQTITHSQNPSLRASLTNDFRPDSRTEDSHFASIDASRESREQVINKFKPDSPVMKVDNPMSIYELQEFSTSTGHRKQQQYRGVPERREVVREVVREDRNANAKSQLRDHALSNLPESIRRVKEDIKKKIEDYRAAISPYKKEKENEIESRSAQKAMIRQRDDFLESDTKQMSKSLRAEPLGRGIKPSEELVSMLKTRGFAFSNS